MTPEDLTTENQRLREEIKNEREWRERAEQAGNSLREENDVARTILHDALGFIHSNHSTADLVRALREENERLKRVACERCHGGFAVCDEHELNDACASSILCPVCLGRSVAQLCADFDEMEEDLQQGHASVGEMLGQNVNVDGRIAPSLAVLTDHVHWLRLELDSLRSQLTTAIAERDEARSELTRKADAE